MHRIPRAFKLVLLITFIAQVALFAGTGLITTVAGSGAGGSAGLGGPAVNAALNTPLGVCYDSAGNLYIADYGNNRVVRVDAATGILTLVAGNGSYSSNGDGGPASLATVNGPVGLAMDTAGNLYIAEQNGSHIRKVDAQTGIITRIAGTGGFTSNGDFGPATSAGIPSPAGIAFDASGNLYIAEAHSVRRVDGVTGIITTAVPQGMNAAINPKWVAFDRSGNLLISDIGYDKIMRLNFTAGVYDVFAGDGTMDFNGDGIPAVTSPVGGNPIGIAVDPAGNVYLAGSGLSRIRRVDAVTGVISTIAGNGSYLLPSPEGLPANLTPINPQAVTIAPNGDLIFTDVGKVRRISLPSPWTSTATSLALSPPSINPGAPLTFTATVTPIGAGGVPTGTVTFQEASAHQTIGTADLVNGTATFTTPAPSSPGTYRVLASYGSDSVFAGSVGPEKQLTVQVVPVATSVSLMSVTNPSLPGNTVNIQATVNILGSTNYSPSGSIQLYDAGVLVGSVNLSTTSVWFSVPFALGTHPLTAVYGGDSHFTGSTSAVLNQVVKSDSTVNIVSSTNPATLGAPVTFTATVSPSAATGTVQFVEFVAPNRIPLGTVALVNGTASLTVSTLSAGARVIQALYSGDSAYNSSSSYMYDQQIKPPATITLASTMNPGSVATQFFINVTVAPSSGLPYQPTGSVQLMDGTTALGTMSLTNGAAQFPVSFDTTGTHSITAVYSGNTAYVGSTSQPFSEAVKSSIAFSVLGSTPNPSVVGTAVTFSATLNQPSATGTVEFVDTLPTPAVSLGIATVINGTASLTTSGLSTGTHIIGINYNGDANFMSGSTSLSQVVKLASTVVLAATPSTAVFGQAVQITASVTPAAATGSVQFFEGATILGTFPINNGAALLSLPSLSAGTHAIGAAYFGDPTYSGANAANVTVTIAKATPSIALSSSQNPSPSGQAITFTIGLTPASATGSVQLLDGSTVVATVSAGTATASVTFGIGTHSVTAAYSGDSNYNSATSAAVSQLVNAATSTSLSADTATSTYGQTVHLTATVTPNPAGGTVQFLDGSTALGTVAIQGGAASLAVATLSVGTHSITAVYSGDGAAYLGSTSAAYTETVSKTATSTALSSSANPSASGQAITLTATVSPATATGTVQFLDGATSLGVVTLTSGAASLTTSALSAGSHLLTAVYSGDAANSASTSAALIQTVNKAATVTTLASSLNPSTFGQAVTFTAAVTPSTATGTVQFLDGATSLGVAALSSGAASLTTSALSAGSHSLTAIYSGDAANSASTSAALIQTVNKAATATTVTSSLNPSVSGQAVTFTASIAPASASGSVQFKDGSTVLGTVTLSGGTATLSVSSLAVGTHSITAAYGGDASFAASISAALTQTVNTPPPGAPTNLTATATSSSQIKLTWTASPTSGVTYNVYSSTTSGFTPSTSNRIATGVGATNYNHNSLTAGTTYYYLVTAQSAAGQSTPSNQASATTQASGFACHVDYSVTTQWNVGFGTAINIVNTGTKAFNNWTLTWTWAGNQQITQSWNSTYTQTGHNSTLGYASWNKNIAAGATVSGVGFNASYSGTNQAPTAFYLNGTLCQ